MTRLEQTYNERCEREYGRLAGKLGLGMILHLLLFNVLTVAAELGALWADTALSEKSAYVVGELLSMAAYVLGFLIPTLILRGLLRNSGDARPMLLSGGLDRRTPLFILSAVALNFAVAYVNQYLVTLMLPAQSMDMSIFLTGADELYELLLQLVATAVIPAVVEELLFRGVILSALLPYGGTTAIIGSAFLFGLMHGNVLQLLYTTMMGVVLGLIYLRTGSLWCCMLIHFFNNAISVFQEFLTYGENETALRLSSLLELTVLVLGLVSAILLLRLYRRKPRPYESGSFGQTLEMQTDSAEKPLEGRVRLGRFFSPSMIVYVALALLSMLATALALLIMGASS